MPIFVRRMEVAEEWLLGYKESSPDKGSLTAQEDDFKIRSPEIEKVPMIKMRINQARTATTMGMILSISGPAPRLGWFKMAMEIPHQVIMAFIVAANSHAPSRYQIASESSVPV